MKTSINRVWTVLIAAGFLAPPTLDAQAWSPSTGERVYAPGQNNDFERILFSPELIMRHHREIGLSAEQRATITEAIQILQSSVVDPEWRVMESSQNLTELLESAPTNEAQALAAIDAVLAAEGEIKRANLSALIRIRNALTEEQRDRLTELRGPALFWGRGLPGVDYSMSPLHAPHQGLSAEGIFSPALTIVH